MGKENLENMSDTETASFLESVDKIDYSQWNLDEAIKKIPPGLSASSRITPEQQIFFTMAEVQVAKENPKLNKSEREHLEGITQNIKGLWGFASGVVASIQDTEKRKRVFTYLLSVPACLTMLTTGAKGISSPVLARETDGDSPIDAVTNNVQTDEDQFVKVEPGRDAGFMVGKVSEIEVNQAQIKDDLSKMVVVNKIGINNESREMLSLIQKEVNLDQIDPLIYRVIDKSHSIDEDYIAWEIQPNLVIFANYFYEDSPIKASAPVLNENLQVNILLTKDMTDLLNAAWGDGVQLYVSSGFRSFYQQQFALNKVKGDTSLVAVPGTSQHHSGLAIDFSTTENNHLKGLYSNFDKTKAYFWLSSNAWKYGFVNSYINNHDGVQKEAEEHHFLYIGKDLAKVYWVLRQNGWEGDVFDLQAVVSELKNNN